MTKQEFLAQLQESLEGNIPLEDIRENIDFYDAYFRDSGRKQSEVCEELGDPRLIARSIIDAYVAKKGPMAQHYQEQARDEYSSTQKQPSEENAGFSWERVGSKIILWAVVVIGIIILCMLFRFLIFVVVPIVLIVYLIEKLVDLFRNGGL